jgi:small subunit ribosomal protein S16
MSVKIRLSRGGTKKRPHYSIVIAESRAPRDGRFIEKIGFYNPLLPKDHADRLRLDLEKAKAWIAKGATPSDRVHRFLSDAGVLEKVTHNNPQKAKPRKKTQERIAAAAKASAPAKHTEEATAKEAPAKEAPAKEAPAEEAAAKEAPAEESPAEEATAKEAPAEESPAEETPAEEAPAEESVAAAEEKPAD